MSLDTAGDMSLFYMTVTYISINSPLVVVKCHTDLLSDLLISVGHFKDTKWTLCIRTPAWSFWFVSKYFHTTNTSERAGKRRSVCIWWDMFEQSQLPWPFWWQCFLQVIISTARFKISCRLKFQFLMAITSEQLKCVTKETQGTDEHVQECQQKNNLADVVPEHTHELLACRQLWNTRVERVITVVQTGRRIY